VNSRRQAGFGTFGAPHLKALVAEVSQRALKTVWYLKWFVHRHLRPEEFGGLVHMTKTKQASYPLHADILNSQAVEQVFAKHGSYFLPHAFPEGCPQHPSYGQGHATVAGACATIVKAWFDDAAALSSVPGITISQPGEDGFSLIPYTGAPRPADHRRVDEQAGGQHRHRPQSCRGALALRLCGFLAVGRSRGHRHASRHGPLQ
jgi:hypothetical protein